jgi:hypothetical protein
LLVFLFDRVVVDRRKIMMIPPDLQPKDQEMNRPAALPKSSGQWLKQLKVPWLKLDRLLLGGAVVAAVGLILTQPEVTPPNRGPDPSLFCQEIVQPKAIASREQLAQLLTVPERDVRAKVQAIVKQPYCKMPNLSIRAGTITERVAYPLASDPQTWLVVAYEGGTYVGYGFKRD